MHHQVAWSYLVDGFSCCSLLPWSESSNPSPVADLDTKYPIYTLDEWSTASTRAPSEPWVWSVVLRTAAARSSCLRSILYCYFPCWFCKSGGFKFKEKVKKKNIPTTHWVSNNAISCDKHSPYPRGSWSNKNRTLSLWIVGNTNAQPHVRERYHSLLGRGSDRPAFRSVERVS